MSNNTPYPVPLTKREQFVMAALQGLCANKHGWETITHAQYAQKAIKIADATMEALGISEIPDNKS